MNTEFCKKKRPKGGTLRGGRHGSTDSFSSQSLVKWLAQGTHQITVDSSIDRDSIALVPSYEKHIALGGSNA